MDSQLSDRLQTVSVPVVLRSFRPWTGLAASSTTVSMCQSYKHVQGVSELSEREGYDMEISHNEENLERKIEKD
jgi:hypothetical protein